MLAVAFRFYLFKGRTYPVFHFIEESRAERETVITVTAFGKKAVNVGIPFEIAAKSMKDHDIAGSKIFGMVQIKKHPRYNTGDGMKEAVQEGTVLKEKVAEIFINGKNAVGAGVHSAAK